MDIAKIKDACDLWDAAEGVATADPGLKGQTGWMVICNTVESYEEKIKELTVLLDHAVDLLDAAEGRIADLEFDRDAAGDHRDD